MKILFNFFAIVAFVALAFVGCQKDAFETFPQIDEISLKSQPIAGNYHITFTVDESFIFVIDQSGAQDISHMVFRLIDCDGNFITEGVTAKVNGEVWDVDLTTGQGTGCTYETGTFIKLDDFNFEGGTVTVELFTEETIRIIEYLIKSGPNCFPFFEETELCDEPLNFNPFCYEWQTETAWAEGARYTSRGNWATYTPYAEGTVTLRASQTIEIGTVTFSAVDEDEDGNKWVTITIELSKWVLAIEQFDVNGIVIEDTFNPETVKIQGYNTAPKGNPAPGLFTTYKGNELIINVPAFAYYGIHLDVGLLTRVECLGQ